MRVAFCVALVALAASCSASGVHVFGAYHYDAGRDCLEALAAVDVIDGPDPGVCSATRCWLDATGEVFVTTTACDAPRDFVDHTTDPMSSCVAALVALARTNHGLCPTTADAGN